MTIQIDTKDCTALTDTELVEMADMGAGTAVDFGVGHFSKAKEDWVLSTTAHIDEKLHGVMFSTLERIGGTPCVLLGLVSVRKTARRDSVLKGLMSEAYHRALMAFPDEDVMVGTRFTTVSGFEAFRALTDIVPRPDHRPVGEERAWGRRLAKRFGVDAHYDEKTFQVKGDGSIANHLDHDTSNPAQIDADVAALFSGIDAERGDSLIACGWVMAESLVKLGAR